MEPISKYDILLSNNEDEIAYKITSDTNVTINGFNRNITLNNGTICNAIYIELFRATTPNYPLTELQEKKAFNSSLLEF